jgi:hypothetical protein
MSANKIIALIFHRYKLLEQGTHFEKCLLHCSVVVHVLLLCRALETYYNKDETCFLNFLFT